MTTDRRKAAVAFVFVTLILDVLSFGLIIPVLPNLVKEFAGGDTSLASYYSGVFGFAWAFMQFFASPILGNLADRFGRRPVLLISLFGMGMDFILMALAPSLWWLFVGRMISGITAGSMSTAQAYIADVTPPEKRASTYGLVGAAFGLGFIFGPVVGGFLGEIDIRLPFWVAAGMALLNFTYGLFVLPESLPPEKRTPFRIVNANPLGSLSLLRSDFVVFRLGLVHFLGNLGHFVLNSTFVLYAGYRYGWGEKMIGITLGLVGIFTALVQGVLVKHVVARIGAARALMIGAFVGSVGMLLYGLASTGPLFWIVMPIMAFWGLTGPSLQQLTTSRIAATDQGKLQGALSALVGIAGMIGPVLFTSAFGWAIDPKSSIHIPGLAFYIASAIVFLSCLSAVSIWNHLRPREVSV